MSKFVEEIEREKRREEGIRKAGQRNAMFSKESVHSPFLNLYGIYSYFREKNSNPLEEQEILEVQNLLKLEINISDAMSFTNGRAKGERLDKAGTLEKEIPEVEEKINKYLDIYKGNNRTR